jgi:UDP-N-acetylmuramate--alanine ligase
MNRVHIIGICGIGMSAIAQFLHHNNIYVQGSDNDINNQQGHVLKQLNIKIFNGHNPGNIQNVDTIIKSNAIKDDNCEFLAAQNTKINILSRKDILKYITNQYPEVIGITGSHGKTTTTGLIGTMMNHNANIICGGIIKSLNNNVYFSDSKLLVVEADESDDTFINLKIDYGIITNIDFEHPEFYKNIEHLLELFGNFTKLKKRLIISGDCLNIKKLITNNAITYGLKPDNNIIATNINYGNITTFDVKINFDNYQMEWKNVNINLYGEHNVYNALAAIGTGVLMDVNQDKILYTLANFAGIGRRFNQIYNKDIIVIDDYAHHPREIEATLRAAKQLNHQRIIAVFEPHKYTRLHALFNDCSNALTLADIVFILPVYSAGEQEIIGINSMNLAKSIKNGYYIESKNLYTTLLQSIQPNDVIVFMGAGYSNKYARELIKHL